MIGPVTLNNDITINTNGAALSFGNTINGVANLVIATGAGILTFSGAVGNTTALTGLDISTTQPLLLGAITLVPAGILSVASGTLTQVPATILTIPGTTTINAGANAITLDQANALAGVVSVSNSGLNNVRVNNGTTALVLGTVSVGTGTLQFDGGGISQSGVTTITQAAGALGATFNGGTGAVTLTNTNEFTGPVSLNNSGAFDVAVTDATGIDLGPGSVGQNLTVQIGRAHV